MSESPYAIPAEDLLTPVPVSDQVEVDAGPRRWADPGGGLPPYADGGGGDADGD